MGRQLLSVSIPLEEKLYDHVRPKKKNDDEFLTLDDDSGEFFRETERIVTIQELIAEVSDRLGVDVFPHIVGVRGGEHLGEDVSNLLRQSPVVVTVDPDLYMTGELCRSVSGTLNNSLVLAHAPENRLHISGALRKIVDKTNVPFQRIHEQPYDYPVFDRDGFETSLRSAMLYALGERKIA